MGVCAYFSMLFETNEILQPKKRFSDEQIREMVRKEFPNRKGQFFSESGGVTVNEYRQRYNKGVFSRNVPPAVPSYRYFKGQAVDGRTGRHFLVQEEIDAINKEHAAFRIKAISKLARKK